MRTDSPTHEAAAHRAKDRIITALTGGALLIVLALALLAPSVLPLLLLALPGVYIVARSRHDAVSLLIAYSVVLVAIPAPLIFQPLGSAGIPSVMLGLGLLLVWGEGRVLPSLGLAGSRQPVRWVALAVAASTLASYVAAIGRSLPRVEMDAIDRGGLFIAAMCGVALLAADGIANRQRLDALLNWVAVVGVGLALLAILQYTTGWDPASQIRIPGLTADRGLNFVRGRVAVRRVLGTAKHPIELGVVLAMVFPLALHYASEVSKRRRTIVPWLGVGCVLLAIPMAVSRAGIVALGTALLVLWPSWDRARRRRAIPLAIIGAMGARVLYPGLLGTIRNLFVNIGSDSSVQARTDDYEQVWTFIAEAPFFGRGFRTFDTERYILLDNQYLLTIVENGFVGLVVLLAVFVVGMSLARGARHRSSDPVTRDLGQSLAASLAAAAVGFVTFDALVYPMTTGLVFLLLGCSGALWRLQGGAARPIRSVRESGAS